MSSKKQHFSPSERHNGILVRGSEIEEERYDVSAQPMFSRVNSLASAAAISEVTFGEPREPPTQYQNGIGYTVTQSVHFGHGSNSMSDIVSDFGEQKLRKQRNQPHFQHSRKTI